MLFKNYWGSVGCWWTFAYLNLIFIKVQLLQIVLGAAQTDVLIFFKTKKMSSVKFTLFDVTSFLPGNLSGFKKKFIRPAIADKINDTMQRNQAKLYRTRNFDICFYVIRPLVPNFFFWKGVWVVDSVCTHFWVFPMISEFPKILSLRLFGNSCGNSYTMFLY